MTHIRKNRFIRNILIVITILSGLLVAALITDSMNWGLGDFVAIGILLFSACLGYELIQSRATTRSQKILFSLGLGALLFLIWLELAVGIFGS